MNGSSKWFLLGCAVSGLFSAVPLPAAEFADSVVAYNPGAGFATEFGTGLGYTNVTAVLGEPARVTPGQFGGPVDPFSPPYLREQILSIGTGGSLTVQFRNPIYDDPSHPFGLDFIVFGSAGFIITNGNFSGGGVTDGSLFGANGGATRISVSQDNVNFYQLNPALAPIVDGLFPTDGLGDFTIPVDPAHSATDFAGLDLAGIRRLYGGSGGGTGFDLSWAQDANGQRINLTSASFVRVDVVAGVSEIDGFAAVPEPRSWLLALIGAAAILGRQCAARILRHE